MIKLQDYTPEVYYKSSRDFQFIGRLYDLVLNYVKTNADSIYYNPLSDNSNQGMTELLALTLGFRSKYHYTTKQLRAICSTFSYALKNKGNVKSILAVCNALLRAEGISQDARYELYDNNTSINIIVSQDFPDVMILSDVLSYLLPAGMNYTITKELTLSGEADTNLGTTDVVEYKWGDNVIIPGNSFATIWKNDTRIEETDRDTAGIIGNSIVYKPEN